MTPVACIILAAGASQRMGRPKALLPYKGTTFMGKLISDYRRVTCQPIAVVLGVRAHQIRPFAEEAGVLIGINPHPEQGLLSSLKIGIKTLPSDCPGFFFCPVDHPAVELKTLRAMLRSWKGNRRRAIRPRYRDRGGHPVLMGSEWINIVLQAPPSSNVRDLLRRHHEHVVEFPVSDAGILLNVDTQSDYERLLKMEI